MVVVGLGHAGTGASEHILFSGTVKSSVPYWGSVGLVSNGNGRGRLPGIHAESVWIILVMTIDELGGRVHHFNDRNTHRMIICSENTVMDTGFGPVRLLAGVNSNEEVLCRSR